MNVIYSSHHYLVTEFPGIDGCELIKKNPGVGTYFQGAAAANFRNMLGQAAAEDSSLDNIDEFLGKYDALLNQPAIYH